MYVLNCVRICACYKRHAFRQTAEVVPSLVAGRSELLSLPARTNEISYCRVVQLKGLLLLSGYIHTRTRTHTHASGSAR
jgi:hypothetical protein